MGEGCGPTIYRMVPSFRGAQSSVDWPSQSFCGKKFREGEPSDLLQC